DIAEYFDRHRDEFTPEQYLSFRLAIPKATSDRNRCLEKLGLDNLKRATIWDVIHSAAPLAAPEAPTAPNRQSVNPQPNASNAILSDLARDTSEHNERAASSKPPTPEPITDGDPTYTGRPEGT